MPIVTEAYTALDSLRVMLRKKRAIELEMMAKGLDIDRYREHVGRGKLLTEIIDMVGEQIKSLNSGDDDDGENNPSP